MPRSATPAVTATLAVIEVHPVKGDRARYTIPVKAGADVAAIAAKAEAVRALIAKETGHTVRIDTHTPKAA